MQKGLKFSAIVAYFQQLATEHAEIRHSQANKRFYRCEIDELNTAIPSVARFPALILEGYSFMIEDRGSDNPVKHRICAFMLLDKVSGQLNYDNLHETWDKLETIGDDIICRIRADKRTPGSPIRDFSMSSVEANLLGFKEFGNLAGIRYIFTIDAFYPSDVNPERWLTT